MDRLSSDDNGELLLQPIGHCKELVDGLAAMAVDESLSLERRTDSARALLGITQKAADPNIVYVNARTVRALAGCHRLSEILTTGVDMTTLVDSLDLANTSCAGRFLNFVLLLPFV